MSIDTHLPWAVDLNEAVRLQENLRHRLVLTWDDRPVNTITGEYQTNLRICGSFNRFTAFNYLRTGLLSPLSYA
jgi:hypothetical protein